MFKTETHAHTLPSSTCSTLKPEEMVRLYKDAGYDTLFISDHFSPTHFGKLGDTLSFSEKVDMLYNSFLVARAEGVKLGINVLFSVELSLHGNHYLLYNVTKEFLKLREDVFDMPLELFCKHARSYGIVIIQAHPLRNGVCVPKPELVDGLEAINSSPKKKNFDEECIEIARKNGLPISCGSDAHRVEDYGHCAILSEEKIIDVKQYLDLLFKGKLILSKYGNVICDSLGLKTES